MMWPLIPMVTAFAVGFLAGTLYRQMKLISVTIFVLFLVVVLGWVNITFTIQPT